MGETWSVTDRRTGSRRTYDHRPSDNEIIEFRKYLGYSSVKIVSEDASTCSVEISPVDKSATDPYYVRMI